VQEGGLLFRDWNVGAPSVDGHPPFPVGAPSENVDALAFISRDRTRFLVDVRRFELVALKCPVASDRESDRGLLPFGPIRVEISRDPLADGVFTDDLGFTRCLIDDPVFMPPPSAR
jgi:hypothetical protein